MLKVGFAGVAHIHTPEFIKILSERADVEVVSVWDHDRARAERRAAELKASVVEEAAGVLENPDIAAVIICSETNRHEELVLSAVGAGKHVFVEKPLGMGAEDSARMAKAIAKAGVIFQTGYFQRSRLEHLFLKGQLAAGTFGKITRVRGSNCHPGALRGLFDDEWRWMADPAQSGCGGFGDLGTHSLDLLMWLLGDVERVAGSVGSALGRYDNCDEFGEASLCFSNGTLGSLSAGWVDLANPLSLLISGTEGHAAVINRQLFVTSPNLEGADGKSPWTSLPDELAHPLALFLDAVLGKRDVPLVPAGEAARVCAVMEAIYSAAKKQEWILVPRN